MLSKQTLKYISKVLEDGYPAKQVEDILLKKGYDKKEVEVAINQSLAKINNGGLKNRIEQTLHYEFLNKADKVIEKFAERMLSKGYFEDQIEKTLVDDGYDLATVRRVLNIVKKRKRREEILHSVFESVKHEEDVLKEEYEILHHEWLKLGIVAGIVLTAVITMLFSDNIIRYSMQILEIVAIVIGIVVALPTGAFTMHHLSLWMHKKEIYFKFAIRYLLIIGTILFLAKIIFPIWVMFVMLIPIIYFLAHNFIRHFDYPYGKSLLLSTLTIIITLASAYVVMVIVGLLIGFYMYAL